VILVGLIVVPVFIIVDLDRPRRGLIRVSQQSLGELQAALRGDGAPPSPAGSAPAALGERP